MFKNKYIKVKEYNKAVLFSETFMEVENQFLLAEVHF